MVAETLALKFVSTCMSDSH